MTMMATHSLECTLASTFSGRAAMPESFAQPLRPEHERGRGAERQKHDERHLTGIREGDERGPLGQQHAEQGR